MVKCKLPGDMVTQTARAARTFFFGAPKTHFDPGKTLVAEVSVAGVMEDHHYNRAVRTHTYMYDEALLHILFKKCIPRMEQNHSPHVGCIEKGL